MKISFYSCANKTNKATRKRPCYIIKNVMDVKQQIIYLYNCSCKDMASWKAKALQTWKCCQRVQWWCDKKIVKHGKQIKINANPERSNQWSGSIFVSIEDDIKALLKSGLITGYILINESPKVIIWFLAFLSCVDIIKYSWPPKWQIWKQERFEKPRIRHWEEKKRTKPEE